MDRRSLIDSYTLAHKILMMNLAGIDEATALARPASGGNCVNWLAGHVVSVRDSLLRLLGEEPFLTDEERELYKRGAAGIEPGGPHTELKRLKEGLMTTYKQIVAALMAMPEEKFAEELDASMFPGPVSYPTVGTMVGIIALHDGYHCGQIGLSRRINGKEGVV
jgi:hypothetical protein